MRAALRVGLAALTWVLVGCDDPFSPGQSIVLPIVSLDAPASVPGGQSFVVRVSIQSGGCRSFTGLDGTRGPSQLVLVAHGRDDSGPGMACPDDIRTDVRDVRVEPPFSGPFTVIAKQPDGTTTTRVVRVE
jgi:hypothetical protein